MHLLFSAAFAVVVTTGAEFQSACENASIGEVIEIDNSNGRLARNCMLTVRDVTVRPVEGQEWAEVTSITLGEGADGARLEQIDVSHGASTWLVFSSADRVEVDGLRVVDTQSQGFTIAGGSATVTGLEASGNTYAAAAIYTDSIGEIELTLRDSVIQDGRIGAFFGCEVGCEATVVVENVTFQELGEFDEDGSYRIGGAIQIHQYANVTVTDSTFIGNFADFGGAIGAMTGGYDLDVLNSTFVDNVAQGGGAIYGREGGDIEVYDSHFCANEAYENGSSIKAYEATDTILSRVSIQGDVAQTAPITLEGGTHTLEHLSLVNNAGYFAIEMVDGALVTLDRSLFYANEGTVSAAYEGGHNAFLSNDPPGPETELGDVMEGDVGFTDPYDWNDCEHKPYIGEDSALVGKGQEGTQDPDGTTPADIGAWWAGAGTNDGGSATLSRKNWLTGGCANGSAAGLVLLLLVRRRESTG